MRRLSRGQLQRGPGQGQLQRVQGGDVLAGRGDGLQRVRGRGVLAGKHERVQGLREGRVCRVERELELQPVRGGHLRAGGRPQRVPAVRDRDVRQRDGEHRMRRLPGRGVRHGGLERGKPGFYCSCICMCPNQGSRQCTPCFPGTYGVGRLETEWDCSACGAGRYHTGYGATEPGVCQACSAGKFSLLLRSGLVSVLAPRHSLDPVWSGKRPSSTSCASPPPTRLHRTP